MKRLYSSPLRVYLALAACAAAGILSGLKLPISLFPNSSKPTIAVRIPYGSQTPQEFLSIYGQAFESQLRGISTEELAVDKLRAHYNSDSALFEVEFKWGAPPRTALKEVQVLVNAFTGRLPEDVRDQIWTWPQNDNAGEIVISFFSASRSLDDLFDTLEPLIMPEIAKVPDAGDPELWNPTRKEVRVELDPRKMAALQLFPSDVERAVQNSLRSAAGGSLTVGTRTLTVQMPRAGQSVESLRQALVVGAGNRAVHLADIARVEYGTKTSDARSYKTSGAPSIILFSSPRPGGNVKKMSEDVLEVVRQKASLFPPDVHYKVLVDPSQFIRSAVNNVFREVGIGALLAVAVLFLFIGSLRNTITAAIEIPLSMVLAFILMRMSGMNLNLISLGGLALSAGMNVDASVVVMENIFRHFEELPAGAVLSFERKLAIICEAVAEVRFAVIASTIASLVVFLPLAFTSALSYAILGDLAKTVVFSHGFSAFVALILVPTVRLHLMTTGGKSVAEKPVHSPIDGSIRKVEELYARSLTRFIRSPRVKLATYAGLVAALIVLAALVLPRLPREVIGTPDTDWLITRIDTQGNTLLRQMESQVDEIESRLLGKFGSRILYTFVSVRGNNHASIMARLRDKGEMRALWPELEKEFVNSPTVSYLVEPWNPSELPIPNPPQLKIAVRDADPVKRNRVTHSLFIALSEADAYPRIWTDPAVDFSENIVLHPRTEQWLGLKAAGASFLPADLADVARVATAGRRAGLLPIRGRNTDVMLRYPDGTITSADSLGAIPIGVGAKIVPLKALADVKIEEAPPAIFRENEREVAQVLGKKSEGNPAFDVGAAMRKTEQVVADWRRSQPKDGPSVVFEDAEIDLHDALSQLGTAVGLSILLIFLTLVVQFGDVVNSLLVLVAVPLGFIGVLLSLWVFRSTLSLNSVLGVILLNGIAVANSIILVDFLKRLVDSGMPPAQAAAEAGRRRLRPILITSATTILGMLPIAFGLGDGGRILQPLGIAVSGGLWVSMGLTLFVVPSLQVSYLEWRAKHRLTAASSPLPANEERVELSAATEAQTGMRIGHPERQPAQVGAGDA